MRLGTFRTEQGRARFIAAYEAAMAELEMPDRVTDVSTSFGCVRSYTWHGDEPTAPPLVLLPGKTAGAPMWAENLPGFRKTGRTIIAFDALGDAGLSVQRVPLRTPADQALWLDEAITALGHDLVHTVGHSFGGATAATHAVRHPQRLVSLTLLEPVFTFGWPPLSLFGWAALTTLPVPQLWREHALASIGGVSPEEVDTAGPTGTLISVASETFVSRLPTPRPLTTAQMEILRMPVYVAIAESRSLAGGAPAATRAERRLPNATVEIWPDTTHSLPMQAREPLSVRLRSFWSMADATAPV
ncbi:alpha/beta fold hydrolase [Agromyces cerinus]|uniref:Pimeloyl-ACP methyl ester carboxylesterase n=1 Tax=Agromyces cerinus subsp. cerinus TaxID=232089 RepID=A0A1N6ER51_9MICO|nr:alpha/beta hydrolase [Agromyces cerinus]SIN85457.1 Pimeloyl-ACP methyl ester carboxylesterase [Agromyces cerinus subsp. cerinus]